MGIVDVLIYINKSAKGLGHTSTTHIPYISANQLGEGQYIHIQLVIRWKTFNILIRIRWGHKTCINTQIHMYQCRSDNGHTTYINTYIYHWCSGANQLKAWQKLNHNILIKLEWQRQNHMCWSSLDYHRNRTMDLDRTCTSTKTKTKKQCIWSSYSQSKAKTCAPSKMVS